MSWLVRDELKMRLFEMVNWNYLQLCCVRASPTGALSHSSNLKPEGYDQNHNSTFLSWNEIHNLDGEEHGPSFEFCTTQLKFIIMNNEIHNCAFSGWIRSIVWILYDSLIRGVITIRQFFFLETEGIFTGGSVQLFGLQNWKTCGYFCVLLCTQFWRRISGAEKIHFSVTTTTICT